MNMIGEKHMSELTWKEVFDSNKMNGFPNIYLVNEFLFKNTIYTFFAFNGRVYKVSNPDNFSFEENKTNILENNL